MSQSTTCDCACPTPETVLIPGVEGDEGEPGSDGSDGISSFTLLTSPVNIPAIGADVGLLVANNTWVAVGEVIFASDGVDWGTFRTVGTSGTTGITATFLGAPGDAAPAAIIGTGGKVTPAGAPQSTPLPIASGGTNASTVQAAITNLGLKKTPLSVYAAGTAYQLTATQALLNFGTTDPSLTIDAPGVYLLLARVRIDYTGATFADEELVTIKLRRTNNTAADLTNSSASFLTQIITTLSHTAQVMDLPPIIYTTTNSNDVLEMWGACVDLPSAGSIDAVEASIVAVRLFDQTL